MNTQTIDILALIGATMGFIGISVYSFRKIAGINRQKFEHFKRATSLRKSSANNLNPQQLAEMH